MIAKLKPSPKNVPKWFVEWCRDTNNDCLSAWHGYQFAKRKCSQASTEGGCREEVNR